MQPHNKQKCVVRLHMCNLNVWSFFWVLGVTGPPSRGDPPPSRVDPLRTVRLQRIPPWREADLPWKGDPSNPKSRKTAGALVVIPMIPLGNPGPRTVHKPFLEQLAIVFPFLF